MKRKQKEPNSVISLKHKIDKYFSAPDRASWKIGQQLCHQYRIDYWVIIANHYSAGQRRSPRGQLSQLRSKLIRTPVAYSCFRLHQKDTTLGLFNPYRRVYQPNGYATRVKITFKNKKDAKSARSK